MNDYTRPSWKDMLLASTPLIAAIALLMTMGGYREQIDADHIQTRQNAADIQRMRDDLTVKINNIDMRSARIEAKLEVLVPGDHRGPSQ